MGVKKHKVALFNCHILECVDTIYESITMTMAVTKYANVVIL